METPARTETRASATLLSRLARSQWLRPLTDEAAIDELLQRVRPTWSLRQIRAEIVEVRQETADTCSLILRPNRHWSGHVAGQHVQVEVEVDGRRLNRIYTLSDVGPAGTLSITVKAQADGRVSRWLRTRARVGQVLTLSPAAGDFVLPQPAPARLLMIAAGSGITPIHAQLAQLAAQGYAGDIVLLYLCRTPADLILGERLQALAKRLPGLKLKPWYTAERGRPTLDALLAEVPDYAERDTLLCGPGALIDAVHAHWLAQGIGWRLQFERFQLAVPASTESGESAVEALASGEHFTARAGQPLLAEAEAAGLTPAYGCRMGICHSCQCRKLSGTVVNLLTGEVSAEPDETIRLCISAARTPLQLDL